MSELLTKHATNSLDECAPRKTFKVRNQHKFGITENTKKTNQRKQAKTLYAAKSIAKKLAKDFPI